MPETIRITSGGHWAHPQQGQFHAALAAILWSTLQAGPTIAQEALPSPETPLIDPSAFDISVLDLYLAALAQLDRNELLALALTLGILCFAVLSAVLLVRTRRTLAATENAARDQSALAKAEIDRLQSLLFSEPQILVVWAASASEEPEIIGQIALVAPADAPHRVLAFGTWLEPDKAQNMERLVDALRARGIGFSTTLTTLTDCPIEAQGLVVGGRAILRLKDVTGVKRALADLLARHQAQIEESETLRALVDAVPSPIWARDEAGKLVFVNPAYARAVETRDCAEALERGIELFDRAARDELTRAHESEKAFAGRLPAIVCGSRRIFDVLTFPARRGSAGIALDATDAEAARAALARLADAHRRTLDQLTTGVAIFGSDQKLSLLQRRLSDRCGTSMPASSTRARPTPPCSISLRTARKLPEEQDFRDWKSGAARGLSGDRGEASTCGICRTGARCASSPPPIPKAA